MIKIGITGNIAAGKSAVENILKSSGYLVFNTDDAAHRLLTGNIDVLRCFGTDDRQKLSKIVFSDTDKLKKLENILHPLVRAEILKFFEANSDRKALFVSVPQLFESGFENLFDKIVLVSASFDVRLKRLMMRNGYDENYAKLRINSQMEQDLKIPLCDFVIDNNSTLEQLEHNTKECLKLLL